MLENNEARLSEAAWKEGNPDWTTLGHVMGLEPLPAPQTSTPMPPPPPSRHQENYARPQRYIYRESDDNESLLKEQIEVAKQTNKNIKWIRIGVGLLALALFFWMLAARQ